MQKFSNLILSILFLLFIVLGGVFILLTPDKIVSETENRTLAEMPKVQLNTIVTGEFAEAYDDYIVDQFPLRDVWIKGYLQWQLLSNQTFIHDYFIDDDWVYPRPFTEVDEDAINYAVEQIDDLNMFAKKQAIELFYFSLPDRRFMIDMDFPKRVENKVHQQDKELLLSQFPVKPMHTIDIGEKWEDKWGKKEYRDFYFRTDHHWNAEGSLLAYEEIHEALHETSDIFTGGPFERDNYEKNCLQEKEFLGSYNRQLYGYIDPTGELLCQYTPSGDDVANWSVYVNELEEANKVSFSDIFGKAMNEEEDIVTYSDLYAEDRSEIHMINPDKSGKVLVLKDSYSNPLLPLLADNFYQTTFYDVRYNEDKDMYTYIEDNEFELILILYSNGRTLDYLYDW